MQSQLTCLVKIEFSDNNGGIILLNNSNSNIAAYRYCRQVQRRVLASKKQKSNKLSISSYYL